jgi:hypothetical protein
MQQLKLNGQIVTKQKVGFWRRQFQKEATKSQKKFDWIFGVFLPAICFFFDPAIFKGNAFGSALLGNYKPFAYILCYFSLFAMSAWLGIGEKSKWVSAIFGGLFLLGGIISFIIGVILIPFSLLGLIIIVGILGFTPLLTSIVYLRNSIRAFQSAELILESKKLIGLYVGTAVLSLIIPLAINFQVEKSLKQMINGNAQDVYSNARTLKFFAPIVNFNKLELYYFSNRNSQNLEKLQAIVDVYKTLTGEDIETKTRVLMD